MANGKDNQKVNAALKTKKIFIGWSGPGTHMRVMVKICTGREKEEKKIPEWEDLSTTSSSPLTPKFLA